MKDDLNSRLKKYLWNSLQIITNNFSDLQVENLGNGYIKCCWTISNLDNIKINFNKSCFYAIRLFDITNHRDKNISTCIMKEIQVSKFQSSISFPIPINKGVYYFEFGYRKRSGDWRTIAYQCLNLGYRIKRAIQKFDQDNWFGMKTLHRNLSEAPHEDAYQLSLNSEIGGSENLYSINQPL